MAIKKPHYTVDLTALQALYERNYINLMRLLPNIRQTGYQRQLLITHHTDKPLSLNFTVLENTPYTSYLLIEQTSLVSYLISPPLYIRCYHDAHVAEITKTKNNRNFLGIYRYPNPTMLQPDEKKQLNLFLNEWLSLCFSQGREATKAFTFQHSSLLSS